MTKAIIERHLLVSGSPIRPEVRDLDRRAQQKGFALGRTGRFGIGVLSYFMIADGLEILTQRGDEAGGDPDNTAWHFKTDGVGSFGQLAPHPRRRRDSMVRLRLRPEVVGSDEMVWFERLASYLNGLLLHVPCRLELRVSGRSDLQRVFEPGWQRPKPELLFREGRLLETRSRYQHENNSFVPFEKTRRLGSETARWVELEVTARQRPRWFEGEHMTLSNGVGEIWAHACYFEQPSDPSLLFSDEHPDGMM